MTIEELDKLIDLGRTGVLSRQDIYNKVMKDIAEHETQKIDVEKKLTEILTSLLL